MPASPAPSAPSSARPAPASAPSAAPGPRPLLAERTGLPQPLLGAIEDLFAVALALAVVTAGRDPG